MFTNLSNSLSIIISNIAYSLLRSRAKVLKADRPCSATVANTHLTQTLLFFEIRYPMIFKKLICYCPKNLFSSINLSK